MSSEVHTCPRLYNPGREGGGGGGGGGMGVGWALSPVYTNYACMEYF